MWAALLSQSALHVKFLSLLQLDDQAASCGVPQWNWTYHCGACSLVAQNFAQYVRTPGCPHLYLYYFKPVYATLALFCKQQHGEVISETAVVAGLPP